MRIQVCNQKVTITNHETLVSGSVNIYIAEFEFDSIWDEYNKVAVFVAKTRENEVRREVSLSKNACAIPWEVLENAGKLKVGVYGIKENKRLPTIYTDDEIILLGAEASDRSEEPTPGIVEQVVAQTAENRTAAENAADRAEKAAISQPYPNTKTGTWWVWNAEEEAYQDTGISYGGAGSTSDHAKLSNRDAADQHPMKAITGLEAALEGKQPAGKYLTEESDPTVPAWAKAEKKPSYTAQEVGADPSGTAAGLVASHNTAEAAHNDIRLLISELTQRLNALADSDDTTLDQLSEVVAYIKSNRTLIEAITTNKVSVSDIIDNLTTNVANKPLSAAQGVALKALIDAISVPEKLPNPNALTFTGAVTGSYDGSEPLSVEIPSGGPAEKTIKLLADIDLTDNEASAFEYTDLDGISEIYIVGGEIKSALDNSVALFTLNINDITIAASSVLEIQKSSGTDLMNKYNVFRYNGLFWESIKSPNHGGSSATGHANPYLGPNTVILNVGLAQKIKLFVPNPSYKPITGWLKIWVR